MRLLIDLYAGPLLCTGEEENKPWSARPVGQREPRLVEECSRPGSLDFESLQLLERRQRRLHQLGLPPMTFQRAD